MRVRIDHHRLCFEDGAPVPYVEAFSAGGPMTPRSIAFDYTGGPSLQSAIDAAAGDPAVEGAAAHIVVGRDGCLVQLARFDRIVPSVNRPMRADNESADAATHAMSIRIALVNAGRLYGAANGLWKTKWGGVVADADVVEVACGTASMRSHWHRYEQLQIDLVGQIVRSLASTYELLQFPADADTVCQRIQNPGPAFPMANVRASFLEARVIDPADSAKERNAPWRTKGQPGRRGTVSSA